VILCEKNFVKLSEMMYDYIASSMKKLILIPLLILVSSVFSQKEWNVLPLKGQELLHSYQVNQMYEDAHLRELVWNKAVVDSNELKKYQCNAKARYLKVLGEFPTETPLNTQITGVISCPGYTIEKIIYESFPGHHVTANLYIPASVGKHPAAVFFCGHEDTSIATESYQKTAILFAQNGFVIFVIDPVSQSERHQFTNSAGTQLTRGSTTEHTLINEGSLLVGKSTPADMIWDNKRGVDYLVSRPEVDTARIGCLGNSGGGIQTLYYMAFDKRMKVAAPCSYFSIRYRAFEINNPDDGCQQLPSEGMEQLDLVDYMTMFAPKPAIVLAGKYDFIYFQGTKDGAEQVKQVYDKFGASDKFSFFVADDGHGISKPKREAVVSFFLQQLFGITKKVTEPVLQPLQAESALNCTRSGSINIDYPLEITIPKRNLQLYETYKQTRAAFCSQDRKTIQTGIKRMLRIEQPVKIEVERTEVISRKGYSIQKIIIHSVTQPPLPCLFFIPDKPVEQSEVILFADEHGKNKAALSGGMLDSLALKGHYILAFDPRGMGETADSENQNDPKFMNNEYRNAALALFNGTPLLSQRVTDIGMVLDFITNESTMKSRPIRLIVKGNIIPAAIHAAVLDDRITRLEVIGNIISWKHYLDNPIQPDQLSQVIPGVLEYYDLPDLVNLLNESSR